MFWLRCTQKVRKQLHAQPDLESTDESSTLLGDWYLNIFTESRIRYFIFLSDATLASVVVRARGGAKAIPAFRAKLAELLVNTGIPKQRVEGEIASMDSWKYGKTQNRSTLGSLNELAQQAKYLMDRIDLDDPELHRHLWDVPMSPLKYGRPRDVVRDLFGLPPLEPRKL